MCCEQLPEGSLDVFLKHAMPMIGVFIGGLLSYWATYSMAKSEKRNERKALAQALAGELQGYMSLMKRRDYALHYREMIKAARARQDPIKLSELITAAETVNDNFPVMNANLGRIGILGTVSLLLAEFHANLNGVFATLKAAHLGAYDQLPNNAVFNLVEEELLFWETNFRRSEVLLAQLKDVASGNGK